MTSYKACIPLHGSPSEEQLTALTDAMGSDARVVTRCGSCSVGGKAPACRARDPDALDDVIVSGDPDHATWSVTFTVEATATHVGTPCWPGRESCRSHEAGDASRKIHVFYEHVVAGGLAVPHERSRPVLSFWPVD
jgi:hypothetical protein